MTLAGSARQALPKRPGRLTPSLYEEVQDHPRAGGPARRKRAVVCIRHQREMHAVVFEHPDQVR